MSNVEYICPLCGGNDVWGTYWCSINTNEAIEPFGDESQYQEWCPDCNSTVKSITKKEE